MVCYEHKVQLTVLHISVNYRSIMTTLLAFVLILLNVDLGLSGKQIQYASSYAQDVPFLEILYVTKR